METPAVGGTWSHGRQRQQQPGRASPRQYPPELKQRAIRMVLDSYRPGRASATALSPASRTSWASAPSRCASWVRQAEVDRGQRAGTTERGGPAHQGARTGEPRAAPGQRDPEERLGFLRGGARPPLEAMTRYIDEHRDTFGVEPICRALAIAPSTYYAAKVAAARRPGRSATRSSSRASAASTRGNFAVYGVRKVWQPLRREGIDVGRDRVGRLMRELGLSGATRTKKVAPPIPAAAWPAPGRPRRAGVHAPPPRTGCGWPTSPTSGPGPASATRPSSSTPSAAASSAGGCQLALRTDLALDALEMAIFTRGDRDLAGLVHHWTAGVNTSSIRYTERLRGRGR